MNNNTKDLLKWIRETNVKESFSDKNVRGLGWGPKVKDGIETGEYSLIFYVDKKRPLIDIPENELLPKTYQIQDSLYKTDVQENIIHEKLYGDCHALNNTDEPVKSNRVRTRTLKSGCETIGGNWGSVVGTLGTFVVDKSDGQIVALSNNHVFSNSQISAGIPSNAVTNTSNISAYQPSVYWKTTIENDYIGTVKRPVVVGNSDPQLIELFPDVFVVADTSCDAAIVKLKDYDTLIDSTSLQPIGFDAAPPYPFATDEEIDSLLAPNSINFGAPIFRSGRTCGPIGYPGNTYSCSLSTYQFGTALVGEYGGYLSIFQNSIYIRGNVVPVRGGDSGSGVLALFDRGTANEKWKYVGLVFAGPGQNYPEYGICCRITNIARDLNLAPWDGTTIPTLSSTTTYITLDETDSNVYSPTVTLSGRVFYQLGRDTEAI